MAPEIPIWTIFRGVAYFLVAYAVCVLGIILVPDIVLWLPRVLMG